MIPTCSVKSVENLGVMSVLKLLSPVVQTIDSAIRRINHYPLDNSIGFASVYPLDSDFSSGLRYPSFQLLGPGLSIYPSI